MTGADHTEFEILIEKRIRGEETPDERIRLDSHLVACGRCRSILDEAVSAVRATRTRLQEADAKVDWPTLERHLGAEKAALRSAARIYAGTAIFGPVMTAIVLFFLGPAMGWRWVGGLVGAEAILVACTALFLHQRSVARRRQLASEMTDLDTLWSAELQRRRRVGRLNTVFVIAYFATITVAPLIYQPVWPILFFLLNPFPLIPLLSPELRRRRQLYERGLIDRKTYQSRDAICAIDGKLVP